MDAMFSPVEKRKENEMIQRKQSFSELAVSNYRKMEFV